MNDTYTLNTGNYAFEPFRNNGGSGKILLATPKSVNFPKLLIKSDNPSSACNEFMYSRLAGLLRIFVPKAYIMNVAKKDIKQFGSPYVVGIEYLEGIRFFTPDEMRSSPMLMTEYAEQFALSSMFEQDDLVQMVMTADGHITGIDFTETFWFNELSIGLLTGSEDLMISTAKRRLTAFQNRGTSYLSAGASVIKKNFGLPDNAPVPEEYLNPMRALYALTEDAVTPLSDTLDEIYPMTVSVYFEEYLKLLKKKIAAYFKSIGSEE